MRRIELSVWNEGPAGRVTVLGTGTDLDDVEVRLVDSLMDLGRDGLDLMMVSKLI